MPNQANVRRMIEQKRQEVVTQIATLKGKLAVYDEILDELDYVPAKEPDPISKTTVVKLTRKPPSRPRPRDAADTVEITLEAAGEQGITARELAEVASLPIGTASGRLSVLKAEGRATHVPPRYFAVHSKREDNNIDQGVVS